jgi:hypothetical protein
MPKAKQRPSVATIVSKSSLEQASARLQALPGKPKETWSLRETVALLQDNITGALNRGYTYDEIVKVLRDKKISITVSSLKRYLATARRDRGDATVSTKPRKTRRPKAVAEEPSTLTSSEASSQLTSQLTVGKAATAKRQPSAAKTRKAAPASRRRAAK